MDFSELRRVAQHLLKSDHDSKKVLSELQIVHGKASPCYSTITKPHCELKMFGVTKDWRENSGRQLEATHDWSAERLRKMLHERRDQEVCELA